MDIDEKLFLEALNDKHVVKNAEIRIVYANSSCTSKLRAWCDRVNSFLQFPTKLREYGKIYDVDIIEVKSEGRKSFYRAAKGSIRDKNTGEIVG